jgi:hypothetical protein
MERLEYLRRHITKEDGVAPTRSLNKHIKMASSPFVFYRGSAPLYYSDIGQGVLPLPAQSHELPSVYVMGDCHSSNFGFFSEEGSHSHSVIFAPNDFDDACVGNAVWDLIRFCVSLHLCKKHCEHVYHENLKPIVSEQVVDLAIEEFLHSYVQTCEGTLLNPQNINTAIEQIDVDSKLVKLFEKARKRSIGGEAFYEKSTLAKAAYVDANNDAQFKTMPEKFTLLDPVQKQALQFAFEPFMDDAVHDIVGRLGAGTGSVNLRRYYFLVGPKKQISSPDLDEFHIVEVKQQKVASPLRYKLSNHPVNRLNPAHLTARCQRHMQRTPDILLDEAEWNDEHWLIRSRHHAKVGVDPEDIAMGKKNTQGGMAYFARLCGRGLALAHCRSERRGMNFEAALTKIHGTLVPGIIDVANDYAGQVETDFSLFLNLLAESD